MAHQVSSVPVEALTSYRKGVVRFWESRRPIFLSGLAVLTTLAYFHYTAPKHLLAEFPSVMCLLGLGFYFVCANLCFSLVYMVEFLLMGTRWQPLLQRCRWWLFVAGCAFGAALTYPMAYDLFRWTLKG
jgi:hypothetical protein